MGRRSKVLTLPAEVKQWLDAALVDGNFTGYQLLADELKARGCEVSKSALQRYGAPFDVLMRKVKASGEQAKALMSESGDDAGALNDAVIRIVQSKTLEVLMLDEDGSLSTDPKFVRAIASLVRASVTQKEWAADVRKEDAEKLAKLEAAAAQSTGKKGLDAETLRHVRQVIYGF